jgi:hypothetical protein
MLSEQFLETPADTPYPQVELEITHKLAAFWQDIFSYRDTAEKPALEDHFTAIDLAANTGHHLGVNYSPRKLRAIRRFSIHRAFRILDLRYQTSSVVATLLQGLHESAELSIVSLNWDIVVENHFRDLAIAYHYGSAVKLRSGAPQSLTGIPVLKLHGSANWAYCDACRTLFSSPDWAGKAALHQGTFLDPDDFVNFESPPAVVHAVRQLNQLHQTCELCGCRMTARVGTFSYRKDYAIQQFQTIWHEAFAVLRESDAWMFIGYSMPEADFEFKQIVKSAALTHHRQNELYMLVILLKDSLASKRYQRFFGLTSTQVKQGGLSAFMARGFTSWLKRVSAGPVSARVPAQP